jgi:hypothetical protein
LYRFTFCRDCFDCVFHICPSPVYQAEDESEGQDADAKGDHDDDGVLATDLNAERNETRQIYFPSYNSKNIECSSKLCVRCRLFAGGIRYSKKHIRLNLNLMAKLIADSFFQMYISEVNMLCAIAPSL